MNKIIFYNWNITPSDCSFVKSVIEVPFVPPVVGIYDLFDKLFFFFLNDRYIFWRRFLYFQTQMQAFKAYLEFP